MQTLRGLVFLLLRHARDTVFRMFLVSMQESRIHPEAPAKRARNLTPPRTGF